MTKEEIKRQIAAYVHGSILSGVLAVPLINDPKKIMDQQKVISDGCANMIIELVEKEYRDTLLREAQEYVKSQTS